eukprot:gene2744-5613_t
MRTIFRYAALALATISVVFFMYHNNPINMRALISGKKIQRKAPKVGMHSVQISRVNRMPSRKLVKEWSKRLENIHSAEQHLASMVLNHNLHQIPNNHQSNAPTDEQHKEKKEQHQYQLEAKGDGVSDQLQLKQKQTGQEKLEQVHRQQASLYMVRDHPANVCVTYIQQTDRCRYHRCGALNDTIAPHGLMYRPDELRTTTMRISGQRDAGSGCVVVHKYRFIVTHVLKSGGSQIKGAFMKWMCNGSHDPVCPGIYEVDNCAPAISKHPDYFIVTFVRNPYSRAISSWAMAVDFMHDKHRKPVDFTDWILDPDAGSRKMGSYLASVHWSPQAMFNTDRRRCPVFDFIGHLETLNEDMVRVAKILNVPELIDAAVNRPLQKPNQNNSGERAAQKRGSRADYYTSEAAKAVTRQFAEDFEIFGFDKHTYMGKTMM